TRRAHTIRCSALVQDRYVEFLTATAVIAPHSDPLLADVVTLDNARAFVIWLRHRPTRNDLTGTVRRLSERSVRGYASEFRTFVRECVKEGFARPDLLLRFVLPKAASKTITSYTDEDIRGMLRVLEARPNRLRNRAIFLLLLDTGVRASELCGLVREDIDLGNRRGKVLGKGGKERWVYFDTGSANALADHLAYVGRGRRVFTSNRGTPLHRDQLYQMVRAWGATAGVSGASVRRVRHTMACAFLRTNPGELYHLQLLLGHQSLEMTHRYARVVEAERRVAGAGPVEQILGPLPARQNRHVPAPSRQRQPIPRRRGRSAAPPAPPGTR